MNVFYFISLMSYISFNNLLACAMNQYSDCNFYCTMVCFSPIKVMYVGLIKIDGPITINVEMD